MDNQQGSIDKMNFKKQKYLNYYLVGFVDGEGAFPIQMRRTHDTRFGFTITPEFKICQHKEGREVLEKLRDALGCGTISIKSGQPELLVLVVKNRRSLTEKVIPFFRRYPFIIKAKQFQLFSEIVERLNKEEHKTEKGYRYLVDLVFQTKGKGKRKYSKKEILNEIK